MNKYIKYHNHLAVDRCTSKKEAATAVIKLLHSCRFLDVMKHYAYNGDPSKRWILILVPESSTQSITGLTQRWEATQTFTFELQ